MGPTVVTVRMPKRIPQERRTRGIATLAGIDKKYKRRYTNSMKTAISIPDNIFKSADSFAKRHGISRSELYATAVAEFLSRRRSRQVTARLDSVYEDTDSALDAEITDLQNQSIDHEKW